MSALTPHIRVLRALGDAFNSKSALLLDQSRRKWEAEDQPTAHSLGMASMVTRASATAFIEAADQLEAEEQALADAVKPKPGDVTHHPKGKAPK